MVWVYSSETGTWGDAISIMCMAILEFDLDRQCLAKIEVPLEVIDLDTSVRDECQFLILPAEGGDVGFLILEGFNARIWKRKAKCDGNTGWVLRNTMKLHLPLKRAHRYPPEIVGFADDYNVVFIATGGGVVFMVHLESAQFKKLPQKLGYRTCYPFTSFCTAGPAPMLSSVPPAMREDDLLTHIEVVKHQELNLITEDREVDRWDPMILEASMSPVPLLSMLETKGRGL
ncbi:uncharacterized protein C2845_PM02G17630 [Panicum miliaceum]|uniref:Uncharacterized protein n=1 Tax=Panicum miliaceum TaxID=4540 RepID=A0A3L6S4J8_PANMI|nr:uncharacterized protein C2845_PM02G17630 [Panicum miliaceum]